MESVFGEMDAVKRLKREGFTEGQSEAIVAVVSAARSGLATKGDLAPLATEAGVQRDLKNHTLAIIGANIVLIGIGIGLAKWLFGGPG